MRCLIVEDSAAFGDAARSILAGSGIDVIAAAGTGAEALEFTRTLRPDIVLVDVDLGAENGFDIAEEIHRQMSPCPAVIMISTHDQEDFADLTAASPALGFLPKMRLSAAAIREFLSELPGT
ncbi:LytR/AlgR family response regulator transcription factor [Mycolicibacterium porcinum]|uniref:Response regulator transcription factor n=1 Tax=Mycolicibacterium porcinum TaxID=39693 RepID=A0AAW5TB68_9MYCO|nr:response regulator transcription factor [Mycolicibacterium porcinum]MCV7392615.1 response regulator transcription factor [Mycolicibacterium porcinum]ORB41349.1 response regulator [Mycolicibacterium porcinum]CDO28565.1 response regulator receiver protein [Mycolicibacterium vulneris]